MIVLDYKVLYFCSDSSIQETSDDFDGVYVMLDPKLRPLEPDRTLEESVKVFNEHKQVGLPLKTLNFLPEWRDIYCD